MSLPRRIRSCFKARQLHASISHQPTWKAFSKRLSIFVASRVYAKILSYALSHFDLNGIFDEHNQAS